MSILSISIDFGTTNSSIARYASGTESARVILNVEGEARKIPSSPVYLGEDGTFGGKLVGYRISSHSLRNPSRARTVTANPNDLPR